MSCVVMHTRPAESAAELVNVFHTREMADHVAERTASEEGGVAEVYVMGLRKPVFRAQRTVSCEQLAPLVAGARVRTAAA